MKSNCFFIGFLFFAIFDSSIAQNSTKARSISITRPDKLFEILETFSSTKTDFESDDEFKKRLPSFDTGKIYYLNVSTLNYGDDKRYSYNLDNKELEIIGGKNYWYSKDYKICTGYPKIQIDSLMNLETYFGTNAFGAQVSIRKKTQINYIFIFNNLFDIPDSILDWDRKAEFSYEKISFKIKINAIPKYAEQLSKRALILVGVKIPNPYESEKFMSYYHEPTFQEPEDKTQFILAVTAKLVSLLLFDPIENKILYKHSLE